MKETEIKAAEIANKIFYSPATNGRDVKSLEDGKNLILEYAQLAIEEYKKSPEFYHILNQVKDKGYYDL